MSLVLSIVWVALMAADGENLGEQRRYTGHTGEHYPAGTVLSGLSGRCEGADFWISVANQPDGTASVRLLTVNGDALPQSPGARRLRQLVESAQRAYLSDLDCVRPGLIRFRINGVRRASQATRARRAAFSEMIEFSFTPVFLGAERATPE